MPKTNGFELSDDALQNISGGNIGWDSFKNAFWIADSNGNPIATYRMNNVDGAFELFQQYYMTGKDNDEQFLARLQAAGYVGLEVIPNVK